MLCVSIIRHICQVNVTKLPVKTDFKYTKWQAEKDKLYIQLDEINKLDNRFYNQSDSLLDFTDNAYQYYLKGNTPQKRRIIEIIKDKITYKDKKLNIELKPIFQTIVENQYILSQNIFCQSI